MSPAEARTIADFLADDFQRELEITLGVLGAVPDDHLDYRPDAKSKTGLGLVRHIALEDEWMLDGIADGTFPPQPDDSDACGIMNSADAVAWYRKHLPAALDRVRSMSGDDLLKNIDMLGLMQAPALGFLGMAVKHSVHHRGQLSAYIRPMGGKVPGIYGPSADTQ